jgi:hypothetical protein
VLSWIIGQAARAGAGRVEFRHRPTGRNQVARSFLQTSGGTESEADGVWSFDVRRPEVLPQHFVRVDDTQVA